jgi:hypothetical protein
VFYVTRKSTRANIYFYEFDPKRNKNKTDFPWGGSRYFNPFKVPTELYTGKQSLIWTQWTWKPSPRSIGFDADENGQLRQAEHQIPISHVSLFCCEVICPRLRCAVSANQKLDLERADSGKARSYCRASKGFTP